MKLKKDKAYSVRQNEQLVELVKKKTGKSVQAILDKAYSEMAKKFNFKEVPKVDDDLKDL
jgi:hypothetical protein